MTFVSCRVLDLNRVLHVLFLAALVVESAQHPVCIRLSGLVLQQEQADAMGGYQLQPQPFGGHPCWRSTTKYLYFMNHAWAVGATLGTSAVSMFSKATRSEQAPPLTQNSSIINSINSTALQWSSLVVLPEGPLRELCNA